MNILFIIRRIVKQIRNDKRSLGLILFVPIIMFTLIYFLLGDSDYHATIAVNGIQESLISGIEAQGITVISLDIEEGQKQVKDKTIDAFLYRDGSETILLFESADAVKTGVIQKGIQNAIKELSPQLLIRSEYIYGKSDDNMFNSLGYVLLGVVSFFIVFIIAGISFVRERTNQTMERLMITPVRRWQVVSGYAIGFGLFAMLQSILLLIYVKWVLHMTITGSLIAAGIIMILLSMAAICIGAFFSIFSNNEFQIMQFIPVVVIPQIFFSGLISLDTLPYNLGILSRVMPVYYACDALKLITVKSAGISEVLMDILALLIFIGIFYALNVIALKKYRRI